MLDIGHYTDINPDIKGTGKNPFILDSKEPTETLENS